MRIAITDWKGQLSPVFDAVTEVLVIEIRNGEEQRRRRVLLGQSSPGLRAMDLVYLHVEVLICGAISIGLESILTAHGIRVVGHMRGSTEEVLHTFLNGDCFPSRLMTPATDQVLGRRTHSGLMHSPRPDGSWQRQDREAERLETRKLNRSEAEPRRTR